MSLDALAPRGVRIAHRIICPGDEDALLEAELAGLRERAARVRRQSGAARIAARGLLAAYGLGDTPLPRSDTGAPTWPAGIVGSLAHDDTIAIAATARAHDYRALGIDTEPALPLPADIVKTVATERERAAYPDALIESRLLFAAKEAIFKALHPIDGLMLDFHDIEIDLEAKLGRTRQGRTIEIALIDAPRVVALAFSRAS